MNDVCGYALWEVAGHARVEHRRIVSTGGFGNQTAATICQYKAFAFSGLKIYGSGTPCRRGFYIL